MSSALENIEIALLLEGVFQHSGYDFRNYAPASIWRRVHNCVRAERVATISALQARVLHDPGALDRFLLALSINVTALFRDPAFYLAFRTRVVPLLRTYPFLRLWLAGCATGEEAYSLAILLQECGLYDHCKIYATDMNAAALHTAEAGRYPLDAMKNYATNYAAAGGTRTLADYYTAEEGSAIFAPDLRQNLLFAQHNLATDSSFNEFHVILCRNVLIYFDQKLEYRVGRLFNQSLVMFGCLCLGEQESLKFSPNEPCFEELDPRHKIYRKTDRNCGHCVAAPKRCEPGKL
ncbi:MAG: protein-glutamate O-methyltransferase CheR [Verrucomicrobiota bacterium]